MDKKKILLSLAAITGAIGGVKADSKINLNSEGDNLRSNQLTFKKILKKQFVLKVNFDDWAASEGVSHTSHTSHSSHRSHSSHSSHRSSTFV